MKTIFIKINDISEINTSKISVRDLNNRYIDKEGRMYGLHYNRKTRKVSIIRIIRTPAKSAEYFNQLLKAQKKEEIYNQRIQAETSTVQEQPSLNKKVNSKPLDFDKFINDTIELLQTHKSRISGIMMNIKNSRLIPDKDKINFTMLNDIFRNLEIEGIGRIEKLLTNYKEIKNYPRSLTYYIAKLDTKNRRIIDELDTDARKMAFIFTAEMFYSIKTLYRTLYKIFNDLNNFISTINPTGSKDITTAEKQYFIDAKLTVENTIDEIDDLIEKLKKIDAYLKDVNNF